MTPELPPLLIDATMLLRWKHLAPVGIVRLERLLSAHLRFESTLGDARYVVWDDGYRWADSGEVDSLDDLLRGNLQSESEDQPAIISTPPQRRRRGLGGLRRAGLRTLGTLPDHLRPFAEQAMWSVATLGVESFRHLKRRRQDRTTAAQSRSSTSDHVTHRIDFRPGTDLVALGLGWEYLDHEAMYRLKVDHGVRIHMPAFDLIPVSMPQMNWGQSHLVHRYYAEMAHYADSITSISHATRDAIREFYEAEMLPVPHLAVNQLPGLDPAPELDGSGKRRHRFEGEDFVLSVSTIEIRKNHLLLAKLWSECIREGRSMPKMVVVGRYGWDIEELHRWAGNAPELDGNFVMCIDVEDDELVELYRDCLFTVFPSRVEGWGLPITESLAYGKACLHSIDPAQYEASQELMPSLHPDDFLGWKREVLRLLEDLDHRESLERTIADRYQKRSAETYCSDFEKILESRRTAGVSA